MARIRILGLIAVLIFVGAMALYVLEFPRISNNLQKGYLLLFSAIWGCALTGIIVFTWRDRFTPARKHVPELAFIALCALFFAPLMMSWLNRLPGKIVYRSFTFISEEPFMKTGYGILRDEEIVPDGYYLTVLDGEKTLHFTYYQQAYFPLTRTGEVVLLPVRKGLLGLEVVELE